MKIASSEIALGARSERASSETSSVNLRAWQTREDGSQQEIRMSLTDADASAQVSISQAAFRALSANQDVQAGKPEATQPATSSSNLSDLDADLPTPLQLLRGLIEALTGRPMNIFTGKLEDTPAPEGATEAKPQAQDTPPAQQGWGIRFEARHVVERTESTQFSAKGRVTLADGRQIQFALDLSMTRTQREESSVVMTAGDAVKRQDPLILNLTGGAARVDGSQIAFRLTGRQPGETLPVLQGAAYLAFDRDGNGKIDDGSELFGPQTNDGFGELAKLDEDGNSLIDENDPAFSKLLLWQPTASGSSSLTRLADAGVGALSLQNTATPFSLRTAGNQELGQIRNSGVFLREDGSAGALQQIDVNA
ncbi:hypothetical protein [Niveibacterium sp. SC-1]|uniref:hypothetical protein n=1 Tax=Niveibacterium sp. SC-1 TaxID=3135646 RepID=UPI00311ED01E